MMTARQTIAIAAPCATPNETLGDRFKRAGWATRSFWFSTILTVNK